MMPALLARFLFFSRSRRLGVLSLSLTSLPFDSFVSAIAAAAAPPAIRTSRIITTSSSYEQQHRQHQRNIVDSDYHYEDDVVLSRRERLHNDDDDNADVVDRDDALERLDRLSEVVMKLVEEMAVLKESCGQQQQQQQIEFRQQHDGTSSFDDENDDDEGEADESYFGDDNDDDDDLDDDELEEMDETTMTTTTEIGRDLAGFRLTDRISRAEKSIGMLFRRYRFMCAQNNNVKCMRTNNNKKTSSRQKLNNAIKAKGRNCKSKAQKCSGAGSGDCCPGLRCYDNLKCGDAGGKKAKKGKVKKKKKKTGKKTNANKTKNRGKMNSNAMNNS